MKMHSTNEAAGNADCQRAGAGRAAQLQHAPNAAMAGTSAAALTLQRYQRMANNSPQVLQLKQQEELIATSASVTELIEVPRNLTGISSQLKAGIESLSGIDLSDVRVHRNSGKPAQLNALAYAQGNDIHLGPGQEQHLPHEAWHVVQQRQGRVQPTTEIAGVGVNDEVGLEREADSMGGRAVLQGAGMDLVDKGKNLTPNRFEAWADGSEQSSRAREVQCMTYNSWPVSGPAQPQSSVQGAVIQRVKIGSVEINSKTSLNDIQNALEWSWLQGVGKGLTPEEREQLIGELGGRKDCADIVADLRSQDSESLSDDQHDALELTDSEDDDLLKLAPQSGFVAFNFAGDDKENERKEAAEAFKWKTFPESVHRMKKIGVHETSGENVNNLLLDGPLAEKFDSTNGLGKGRGFYVTHVGKRTLYSAIKGVEWGTDFLAVYVPQDMLAIQSLREVTNNVSTLDEENIGSRCYYIMSGGSEIVIPQRSLPWVKLVTKPEQLVPFQEKQSDVIHAPSLGVDQKRMIRAVYNEEVDFAFRMNDLTVEYKHKSTTDRRKKHLAQRWNHLQNTLFHRWGINGRLYTLWLDTQTIGTVVKEPGNPEFG